jgi:ComF family protein
LKAAVWGADFLDLLLPAGCATCGDWIPGGRRARLICGRCASALRPAPWPRCRRCHFPRATGRAETPTCRECEDWPEALDFGRYAYLLQAPASDLVHSLKYDGWMELAEPMAQSMARVSIPDLASRRTVVTPMPTTAVRVRERGYNQAGLLACAVARLRGLPLAEALKRVGATASQTSLPPSERKANVRGAFSVDPSCPVPVEGSHVILVDDVLTTGATAASAASQLASAGAHAVTILAYARALPGGLHSAA